MRPILLMFLFLTPTLHAEAIRHVRLDNGHTLIIEQISHARNMPYLFYDQSMESIPNLYPEVEILLERRLGYLGSNDPVRLISLIAYIPRPDAPQVLLRGMITEHERAWAFQTQAPRERYDETLLLSLEFLSSSAL